MQTTLDKANQGIGNLSPNLAPAKLPAVQSGAARAPAAKNSAAPSPKTLLEALTHSRLYLEYERAFNDTTGLPLALRPVDSWQLPHHRRARENRFCALMAAKSKACAACLQAQQQLSDAAASGAQSITCAAGLCDMAVPVRLGDQVIGFLQTGQVFRKKPTEAHFDRTARLVADWGVLVGRPDLREAFFETRILSNKEHDSLLKLLTIFAEHLSMVSNQIAMHHGHAEPPVISRAKSYIQEHQSDDLSLGQVAKAVNTSTFYFCKMFKKVTGLNFTDYVSRLRIEKAKNLLLNPNLRVSEIAYEVGFQSLTHFNRVFKKILGQSPTEYRGRLPAA